MEAPLAERIRPQKLEDYISQLHLVGPNGSLTQQIAKGLIPSLILWGPPGTGKTTLAQIMAQESKRPFYQLSAIHSGVKDIREVIEKAKQSSGLFTAKNPILFIDEIHRIPRVVEEVLYSAMEDFAIDIITGKDSTATTLRIELPPFTLVGATTRVGDITAPLRDRFGIVQHLDYYNSEDLQKIIMRTAKVFNFKIAKDAAFEIAKRSRGTPRIANRLFKRVRDFAQFEDLDCKLITLDIANKSLEKLLIDSEGLNITDRRYLKTLIEKFNGGPAGLNAIASTLAEDSQTLEDVIEPFLLKNGFITRTPRGRVATEKAYKQLKIGMYEYES